MFVAAGANPFGPTSVTGRLPTPVPPAVTVTLIVPVWMTTGTVVVAPEVTVWFPDVPVAAP